MFDINLCLFYIKNNINIHFVYMQNNDYKTFSNLQNLVQILSGRATNILHSTK